MRRAATGFTLVEVLISFLILSMVMSGLIYGYVQANRMAEWSSMSLAAQSYAAQGLEQARAAKWDTALASASVGPGTGDELGITNFSQQDTLDIPVTGQPLWATNYISITPVTNAAVTAQLRQIRSDCVWVFPISARFYTNTAITLRAPDQ